MSSTLEYGEISAIDYPTCRVRVRLDERDGVESYWLNVPQRHSLANQSRPLLPELGEQGAVLLSADGVGGVWLGGLYSTAEPPPVVDKDTEYVRFSDGTRITYNRAEHLLNLDCVGAVTLKCAQNLRIEAAAPVLVKAPSITLDASQTTLNGNLQINGSLYASGTVMDAGGNSNHHSH